MIRKYSFVISLLFFVLGIGESEAQSFWFGPKGGVGLGTQQGVGANRSPAFVGHIGFFVETYSDETEDLPGSLFASIGLHQRGSSTRSFSTSNNIFVPGRSFLYNNVSLQLGVKKFMNDRYYYMVGVRGEYTAFTNLTEAASGVSSANFPLSDFVFPVTAGIMGGAGMQFNLAELYGAAIEFSVHPDFFNQYRAPELQGIINPITGVPLNIPEKAFRNTTLELTLYLRFLRKVIYY